MPDFPVNPDKSEALRQRMAKWGIREADLDESFVRSGGPGGQNVNKVSTCVVLVHRPSGLSVRCQQERSQALNRFLARRLLVEKMEQKVLGTRSEKQQEFEKIRRQKRRRGRKSKEKMLNNKHHRSEIKSMRKGSFD